MTPAGKRRVWLIVACAVLAVLAAKGIQSGWFAARSPLDLNGEPALLFFNNDRGCDCALVIYRRADAQIAAWPEEARHRVPLVPINLEQRPDLGGHYGILRAPTLLLLDAAGDEVWRQDEVMSDSHIFDLEAAEAQIATFLETGVQ
jgi:hypothetical protein